MGGLGLSTYGLGLARRSARSALWTPAALGTALKGLYLPNRLGLSSGAAIASLSCAANVGPTLAGTATTFDTSILLRGHGAARFVNSSGAKLAATSGGVTSGSHTMLVVARTDDPLANAVGSFLFLGQPYPANLSMIGTSGSSFGSNWMFLHTGAVTPIGGPHQDNKPHVIVKSYNAASGLIDAWLDGVHVVKGLSGSPGMPATLASGINIGGAWASGSTFETNKHVWGAVVMNTAVDAATLYNLEEWSWREFGVAPVVMDGDSIAKGTMAASVSSPYVGTFTKDIGTYLVGFDGCFVEPGFDSTYLIDATSLLYNFAVPGTTSAQINARIPTGPGLVLPGYDAGWERATTKPGIPVWIVLSDGSNDIAQSTLANHTTTRVTGLANIQSYCSTVRAKGARVILLGIISDPNNVQPSWWETDRQWYNAAFAAGEGVWHDGYVNPDAVGTLHRSSDGFHPDDYGPLAGGVRAKLVSAMGLT